MKKVRSWYSVDLSGPIVSIWICSYIFHNDNNLFQVQGEINQCNAYTSWTYSYSKNWVSLCHNCSDHWTVFCRSPSNKGIKNESTFTTFCHYICSTLQYPKGNSRGITLLDCVSFLKLKTDQITYQNIIFFTVFWIGVKTLLWYRTRH